MIEDTHRPMLDLEGGVRLICSCKKWPHYSGTYYEPFARHILREDRERIAALIGWDRDYPENPPTEDYISGLQRAKDIVEGKI